MDALGFPFLSDPRQRATIGAMTATSRPVLLVHGAWHGAWIWADLVTRLAAAGIPAHAIDLPGHGASPQPLGDLNTDADAVAAALERLGPDTICVGHSYGGAVVSAASARSRAHHLVYIAAFALNDGESVNGFLRGAPRHDVDLAGAMQPGEDATTLDPIIARDLLYADLDDVTASAHVARLTPQPFATMTTTIEASGLGAVPSTYVLCTRDRCVHPEHQQLMAQRCDTTVTLDEDHSPFLTDPDTIVELICGLATQ